MSETNDAVNQIAANVVRLARAPGRLLLVVASVPVGAFLLLGLLLGLGAAGWTGWVPFALAALLAVPVVVLAVRRARLQRATESLPQGPLTTPGGVVVVSGDTSRDTTMNDAVSEAHIHTTRWFPRVEAAQRALLRAAGGPVKAPYLRDDLRVTLLAFLGTAAAIPLGILGAFITAFALLL